MTDYTTPTTPLQAVNEIISQIGELPISDLAVEETSADVKAALLLFRSANRTTQVKGWQFNTDLDVTLTREPDGTISVPADAVKVSKAKIAEDTQYDVAFAIRGAQLYNRTTNSFAWDTDLRVDLIRLLPFESLPEAARHFIVVKSGRQFQARFQGSQLADGFSQEDLYEATVALSEYEVEQGRVNFLTGSSSVTSIWGRDE